MKPIIEIRGLSKRYRIGQQLKPYNTLRESFVTMFKGRSSNTEKFWALQDISFDVEAGESLAIIGLNGAGKTTLLKVLSRITSPTKGQVILRGRMASLLEVGTGFHPELTGSENIFLNGSILGLKRREIIAKYDSIVEFSGVEKFLDTPIKHYSSGMSLRLAFAVAAHLEPEILAIDEILAVGDVAFQRKSLDKMNEVASSGHTVLFVSHNLSALNSLCKTAVFLEQGKAYGPMSMTEGIDRYIGSIPKEEVLFENETLEYVRVRTNGTVIEITAKYKTELEMKIPNLGFVISDNMGQPICGSNPMKSGVISKEDYPKEGHVSVSITQPRLDNGVYRLSIWFGDGTNNSLVARDCLTFEVQNSKSPPNRTISLEGSVLPDCEWVFE